MILKKRCEKNPLFRYLLAGKKQEGKRCKVGKDDGRNVRENKTTYLEGGPKLDNQKNQQLICPQERAR